MVNQKTPVTNADKEESYVKGVRAAAELVEAQAGAQFLAGLDREAIALRGLAADIRKLTDRLTNRS